METPVLTKEQARTRAQEFLAAKFGSNGFALQEELTAETAGHWVIFWTWPDGPSHGNDTPPCPPLLVDRQTGEVEMTLRAIRPAAGESPASPEEDVRSGE